MSLRVTIRAIREYLSKARQAQRDFEEASDEMKKAAETLCNRWQGDAAVAFAKEQGVFDGWCKQMSAIGIDYMSVLEKAIAVYEGVEMAVKDAINKQ